MRRSTASAAHQSIMLCELVGCRQQLLTSFWDYRCQQTQPADQSMGAIDNNTCAAALLTALLQSCRKPSTSCCLKEAVNAPR